MWCSFYINLACAILVNNYYHVIECNLMRKSYGQPYISTWEYVTVTLSNEEDNLKGRIVSETLLFAMCLHIGI